MDQIALMILIIGGLDWGCVGLFGFDVIGWIFGGQLSLWSRIIYVLVAVAALWCIRFFFIEKKEAAREKIGEHSQNSTTTLGRG
jgi:hypothetical protein